MEFVGLGEGEEMKKRYVVLYYKGSMGLKRSHLLTKADAQTLFDVFDNDAEMMVRVVRVRQRRPK